MVVNLHGTQAKAHCNTNIKQILIHHHVGNNYQQLQAALRRPSTTTRLRTYDKIHSNSNVLSIGSSYMWTSIVLCCGFYE